MYRVYLRRSDGRIIGNVSHPLTREEAEEAFAALVNQAGYDGFAVAAVLTELNRPIAVHRFDRDAVQTQFFRHRMNQLPYSSFH